MGNLARHKHMLISLYLLKSLTDYKQILDIFNAYLMEKLLLEILAGW